MPELSLTHAQERDGRNKFSHPIEVPLWCGVSSLAVSDRLNPSVHTRPYVRFFRGLV